jgi:hypothetical protein
VRGEVRIYLGRIYNRREGNVERDLECEYFSSQCLLPPKFMDHSHEAKAASCCDAWAAVSETGSQDTTLNSSSTSANATTCLEEEKVGM